MNGRAYQHLMLTNTIDQILGLTWSRICPHCKKEMRRIRRTKSDRLLSVILPIHRCRCCHMEERVRVMR